MLQQTQVETVIPYFIRFVNRFPNIKQLAFASLDEVLQLWEGLGYYRRARSLHMAAQEIVRDHRGRFPRTFADVLKLPGVGRYTAGAILSIATDARLPILEGNTVRLFTRLLNLHEPVQQSSTQNQLWQFAEQILPTADCGNFNQALMELGNQICKPKQPLCQQCPVSQYCTAYQEGAPESLPLNPAKTSSQRLFESLFLIEDRGRMLLKKCESHERWQGLYDFPRLMNRSAKADRKILQSYLLESVGIEPTAIAVPQAPFWSTTHCVTKFKINLDVFRIATTNEKSSRRFEVAKPPYRWFRTKQIANLPLNKTARSAFNQLKSNKS